MAVPPVKMNWDLESYFPTFNGPEMISFRQSLESDLADLRSRADGLEALSTANDSHWESIFLDYQDLLSRISHLGSYVGCLTAADARNEEYAAAESSFDLLAAEFSKLEVELLRGLRSASDALLVSFAGRPRLAPFAFFIKRLHRRAQQTMSPDEEKLAADLAVDGIGAWGRLYNTLSGKLEFEMQYPDGRTERLPMSQRRSLMEQADRDVRRAAFDGGNLAWSQVEDAAAAALNAISGTRLTLNRHRGVTDFLDVALFDAAISRATLDAMFSAIVEKIDVARSILQFKADLMNTGAVAWYDLGAPLPVGDQQPVDWEKGKELVGAAFHQAYPELGSFVDSVYERDWVEWEPRTGKRPGGFCTGSLLTGESRIFMTYNQTMGDVRTLAHEVGHAFHSFVMRDQPVLARLYPMTLAESASTFGEMILTDGILNAPGVDDQQKAAILDMETGHGAIYLLDIPVRFEFEKAMYEERAQGELSVTRLKELMCETQRRLLGDLLEEGGEDPYFWASKLHFYITGTTFYNFPYTFGFLLSRGLYARFRQEGSSFLPRYAEFLRSSGSDSAEKVARNTIDCDLETPEFWIEAIVSLEDPLRQLRQVIPKLNGAGPIK
jgi:oligoendopeptidase F